MPRSESGKGIRWDTHLRDKYRCVYCDLGLDGALDGRWDLFTNDHLVPEARGGQYVLENVVTACLGCNALKAGFDPRDAGDPVTPTAENRPRLILTAKHEIDRRRLIWHEDVREILRQAGYDCLALGCPPAAHAHRRGAPGRCDLARFFDAWFMMTPETLRLPASRGVASSTRVGTGLAVAGGIRQWRQRRST